MTMKLLSILLYLYFAAMRPPSVRPFFLAAALALLVSLVGCAASPASVVGGLAATAVSSVVVDRSDGSAVTLDAAALAALPRESFTAQDRDALVRYTGIDLRHVLQAAGVEPPQALHGSALRRVLLVRAADGYAAAFALAELDPTIGGKRAFLVDRAGDAPLAAGAGPWRVVVPAEGRPTRWVRQVTRLGVIELR